MFETGDKSTIGTIPSGRWALLEERAKEKGLSLHAALREAILDWTRRVV